MRRTTAIQVFARNVLKAFQHSHPAAAAKSKRLHLHTDDMGLPDPEQGGWRPVSTTVARLARCRATASRR